MGVRGVYDHQRFPFREQEEEGVPALSLPRGDGYLMPWSLPTPPPFPNREGISLSFLFWERYYLPCLPFRFSFTPFFRNWDGLWPWSGHFPYKERDEGDPQPASSWEGELCLRSGGL